MKIESTKDIRDLFNIFKKHGFELYAVGGAVRDMIMGKNPDDIDFCTSALPSDMLKMFPYAIRTGEKHGTLTIGFRGKYYEVTTFRVDGEYKDSRHPLNVVYSSSLKKDLSRRDFTINALALNIETGEIVDLFNGKNDIKKCIIRTVGNPNERFSEDALRIIRAIRFVSKLNFKIERKTYKALLKLKDNISFLSKERIKNELFKMVSYPYINKALKLLYKTKIDSFIFNSVKLARKIDINTSASNSSLLRLTAIFVKSTKNKKAVLDSLLNLKCSNEEIKTITHLFDHLQTDISKLCTDYEKRLFLSSLKREYFNDYFVVLSLLKNKNARLKAEFEKQLIYPLSISELKINGNDLIKQGFKGKDVGEALNKCFDAVLVNPKMNTEQALIQRAESSE